MDNLGKFLAQNVTSLRQKRGLSQLALSKVAKVPRSTITYIESGAGNPSLQNLAKVAGALQISIEELLSAPRAECLLIDAKNIPKIQKAHGNVEVFKLLPDQIPGTEIDRMEIVPGGRLGGVPHVANTKEYLTVIQGQVQIAVSGLKFDLKLGDVFAFPGDQPHSYFNPGKAKAICISVVIMTQFGEVYG